MFIFKAIFSPIFLSSIFGITAVFSLMLLMKIITPEKMSDIILKDKNKLCDIKKELNIDKTLDNFADQEDGDYNSSQSCNINKKGYQKKLIEAIKDYHCNLIYVSNNVIYISYRFIFTTSQIGGKISKDTNQSDYCQKFREFNNKIKSGDMIMLKAEKYCDKKIQNLKQELINKSNKNCGK